MNPFRILLLLVAAITWVAQSARAQAPLSAYSGNACAYTMADGALDITITPDQILALATAQGVKPDYLQLGCRLQGLGSAASSTVQAYVNWGAGNVMAQGIGTWIIGAWTGARIELSGFSYTATNCTFQATGYTRAGGFGDAWTQVFSQSVNIARSQGIRLFNGYTNGTLSGAILTSNCFLHFRPGGSASGSSGYMFQGTDLDAIFEALPGGYTKAAATGIYSGGSDLNNRYARLADGGAIGYNVNYNATNGQDLSQFFARVGSLPFTRYGTLAATFSYTGGVQYWTVPAGVYMIRLKMWGGAGSYGQFRGSGGGGGTVIVDLPVTPGTQFTIYVGSNANNTTGGWPGGGNGGAAPSGGGGGGGYTSVAGGGYTLYAGGGGGGGGTNAANESGYGRDTNGGWGGMPGWGGGEDVSYGGAQAGKGATWWGVGTGGYGVEGQGAGTGGSGTSGGSGAGGAGHGGGGGGGGYRGGGGGGGANGQAAGGGGGGTNYCRNGVVTYDGWNYNDPVDGWYGYGGVYYSTPQGTPGKVIIRY